MIRAPGGSVCFMMFLLWFFRWRSKTFGLVVLLPFKLWLFREPICKIVYFELWTVCLLGKRPMCIPRYDFAKVLFCHNIILPKYDFAKISFCQSLFLPQYHFAKISFCQSIVFAKIWWCQTFIAHFLGQMPALIDILKLLVSLRISGSSFVGSIKSLLKDVGSTGTITPVSGLSVSLRQWISKKTPQTQERARKGRWFQWNHHPRLRLIFGKCSGS